MLSVTSAQLNGWLIAFIWPFTRVLGLLATAPVTSGAQFPARGKIALALPDQRRDRAHVAGNAGHRPRLMGGPLPRLHASLRSASCSAS